MFCVSEFNILILFECILCCFCGVEFIPRVVFTKQTQWQGILGPINITGFGFSPGQYYPGVEIYKGIPYASPPISGLRYEIPGGITTLLSNKTYIANESKPPCPKQYSSLNIYRGGDIFKKLKNTLNQEILEDCLYLDVYAPRISQKNNNGGGLPVLVYANSHDDDSEDPFDGSSLAAIGNIIVVNFRYRVGVLGFLHPSYSENIKRNFGLLDQLAALNWVKENINGFGGDENNICLMGFDMDASFVGILGLSPPSQAYGGLFNRIILLNGSPLSPLSINHNPFETTMHMARALNCPLHEINGELGLCLRQRGLDQLIGAAHSLGSTLLHNHWAPSVDGIIVQDNIGNINRIHGNPNLLKNMLGKYDILCGLGEGPILPDIGGNYIWNNLNLDGFVEAILKLTLNLDQGIQPSQNIINELKSGLINAYGDPHPYIRDILDDFLTVYPMINLLNIHSQTGKNTFFYVSKKWNPLGKIKNNDISYIFSNSVYKWKYIDYGQPNTDLQPYELLITFIANFVRSGDPNVQNPRERFSTTRREPVWPKYRAEKGSYLQFGRTVDVKNKYRKHWMDFWFHLFPTILKQATEVANINERNPEFPSNPFPKPENEKTKPINGTSKDSPHEFELISSMTQNTVVMVGGFLLLLNLLCFMGLFYQRQKLKRTELRFRRRYFENRNEVEVDVPEINNRNEIPIRIPESDLSEPYNYGYINPNTPISTSTSQQPQPIIIKNQNQPILDTMSETETDNGFGTDFLGPNYDPRTKVTRWMFEQNKNKESDNIQMKEILPYSNSSQNQNQNQNQEFYTPFQPSCIPISDIPYADSRTTTPSILNYNYKIQQLSPQSPFNNNLATNNFNNPRRIFTSSPSNSGTTTLSNPDHSHHNSIRRNKGLFPLRNSIIVKEVDLEDYTNSDNGLVVTDEIKLVPVKTGTLTRSVGVGDNNNTNNSNNNSEDILQLQLQQYPNTYTLPTNRHIQKVTFVDDL